LNPAITVTQKQLSDFLLNVALVRPVFIWGPPGIGKSSLVQQFTGFPSMYHMGPEQPPVDVERALAGLRYVFPRSALKMWRRSGLILRDEGVAPVFMLQPMLVLERGRLARMSPEEQRLFRFNVESYRTNYEQFARDAVAYIQGEAAPMAADVGGTFLDLTGIYRDAEGQIFTDYAHLTPHGNEWLARYVAARILPVIRAQKTRHPNRADGRTVVR